MMTREYVRYPKILRELPADGKVTGPVEYAFTDGNHVSMTVDAHVNDHKPAIVYRGEDFLPHVHAYRHSDGTWHGQKETGDYVSRPSVTRRQNWSDAPPSFAKAIVATMIESVAAVATSEVLRAAAYAAAYNDESHALDVVAELADKLDAAQRVLDAATRVREHTEARRI